MAYNDNYPNGYKSGYSSADDPERQNYSPYGWESAQRNAFAESEKREREMKTYQEIQDEQKKIREKYEAEQQRQAYIQENIERESREQAANRRTAVNLIVEKKRDEYNKKSYFGKAIAKLRGKSFDKMKWQITVDANKKVGKMSPELVEEFIESQTDGRSR